MIDFQNSHSIKKKKNIYIYIYKEFEGFILKLVWGEIFSFK